MTITVRSVVSLVVGLAGVATMAWAVNTVLNIGTCASGGAYAIARQCPSGNGTLGFFLIGGFVAFMAGLMVSVNGFKRPGTGQVIWCALFLVGGTALLIKALTAPHEAADARLACYIMSAVFIPIGLPVAVGPFIAACRDRSG
jgi:hypothetical protein